MKRTWTIIGVSDVPGSFRWYQSLFGVWSGGFPADLARLHVARLHRQHVGSPAPLAPGCIHPQGRARLDQLCDADAPGDARTPEPGRAVCASAL